MVWALSLAYAKLCPRVLTGINYHVGIRSLVGKPTQKGTANHSVLYPPHYLIPLRQNAFRREPAITRLDKLITSNHNSSGDIALSIGSDLHFDFSKLHPGHG